MKKILSLILAALILCSSLAACTPADPDDTTNNISSEEKAKELESTISITTKNYQINNAMVSTFFNWLYKSELANYSAYLTALGLDSTKPLKDQTYGEGTWLDFFLEATLSQLEACVLFAEVALENGITLTDEQKAGIDDYIKSFEEEAISQSITTSALIENYFGAGVTEETVRKCLEMQELSYKMYSEYMDGLSFEDSEYTSYFNEHTNDFLCVNYYSVPLSVTIPEDATESEVRALKDELIAAKDSLIAAKTEEEFKAAYTAYLEKKYEGNDAKTDLVIRTEVESTCITDVPISQLSSCGFDPNAEFKEGLSAVNEGTNRYTVYFIATDPAREDYCLRNIRHIMLTPTQYETSEEAEAKASEILEEYLAGDKTAEAFGELANKYSADSSTNQTGGLYTNVPKNYFSDASFNDWIYDSARVEGDTGIVSTSSGYHVMYYAGESDPKWKLEVLYALKDEAYLNKLEELSEKYSFTKNEENLDKFEA